MSPSVQVEPKPVVIDLTLDSPPKPIRKPSRPKIAPVAPPDENVDTVVSVVLEDALGRQEQTHAATEHLRQPVHHSHPVRFMSPTELPSMHARYRQERSGGQLEPHQLNAFRRGEYNDQLVPSFELISAVLHRHCVPDGDRGEFTEAGDETLVNIDCGSGDPALDAVVDVLNKLHQVRIPQCTFRTCAWLIKF